MCLMALIGCMAWAMLAAGNEALPLKPPKQGGVYVIAHRGVHDGIPENTLPAYKKAIEIGADFVEIDVRTTKDGHFVSIHNGEVNAYTKDAEGPVASFTLEQLRAMDIGSRVGPQWKEARIPTLEEILELCKGRIGIYLDLKNAPIPELARIVKARGMEHEMVWYIGGSMAPLLRSECPDCIAMPDPGPEMFLPGLLSTVKPRIVATTWKHCSRTFVEKCHASGALVFCDDGGPETWQPLLERGVDGIQTDRPEELIRLLGDRDKNRGR
ncbi:MAG TPA: glycerophosphodiester phosphodiesterase family protein [Candidatus Hydrogenedentes bacterium]|nr:glycerophosphodiester phosphodiesterase family protein [Candidatus Hydrogenedentota bacterium]